MWGTQMCFEDECEMFQAWHVGVLRMAVPLGMLEYGVPVCLCPVDPTEWDNHFEYECEMCGAHSVIPQKVCNALGFAKVCDNVKCNGQQMQALSVLPSEFMREVYGAPPVPEVGVELDPAMWARKFKQDLKAD